MFFSRKSQRGLTLSCGRSNDGVVARMLARRLCSTPQAAQIYTCGDWLVFKYTHLSACMSPTENELHSDWFVYP